MNTAATWTRVLTTIGYVAMLIGAVDPLEGSLAILPGSALVALGAYLSPEARPWLAHRIGVFGAIAVGVAALFGLSAVGGIGGKSGLSLWWGLLVLPYLAGWLLGIGGPGVPRWVQGSALIVGLWYVTLPLIVLLSAKAGRKTFPEVLALLGGFGLAILGTCLWRLRRRRA